jgi:carbonic anhydrase/acetyltransferase-like protein (isoleucine patch superfamily)
MSILEHQPQIAKNVFIAPNATVIGNVILAPGSSVWYGAVLRGDNDLISIGENSNIQDLSVVHVDPNKPVSIGKGCTIGHRAIVHGATIGDNVLIGMGAIVMNNVVIGENCIVGAGALITENKVIPPNSLVLGSPAKVVKSLSSEQVNSIRENARVYVENAKRFAAFLTK